MIYCSEIHIMTETHTIIEKYTWHGESFYLTKHVSTNNVLIINMTQYISHYKWGLQPSNWNFNDIKTKY
jgi:hypothetical protein